MKKSLLFSLLFTLTATAAAADEVIVLDSTSVIRHDYGEDAYELREYLYYNAQGQRTETRQYSNSNYLRKMVYSSRFVNIFDDKGNVVRSNDIDIMEDGSEVITEYTEYSDFNDLHQARQQIIYELDDETGKFEPDMKTVLEYQGQMPVKAQMYEYEDGTWVSAGVMEATLNSFGQIATAKTTVSMEEEGYLIQMVINQVYEYNDRHNVTKITTTSSTVFGGVPYGENVEVQTYEYLEYDAYGNPKVFKTYEDGELEETETDWYGPLKAGTGIGNIFSPGNTTTVYTLDGKRVGKSLSQVPAGIYIVKDRNGIRKVTKK